MSANCGRPNDTISDPAPTAGDRGGELGRGHALAPSIRFYTIGFHILWPAYTIGVCGFYLWRRQHLEFAGAGFSAA